MSFETLMDNLELISEGLEKDGHNDDAAEVDKAIAILNMINQWSEAYPEDIFHPVDWKRCHAALKQVDISGSAMAADCMRYVVTTMKKSMESMS